MSEIWKTRDDWDRGRVAKKLGKIFEETLQDIELCQGIGPGSMEIDV